MDYVKFALFFSLLEGCSAVSLQEVAASLASAEDMLKALSEKNNPAAKVDTSVLKMELEEYIDDEISRKTKLKFDNDMLLRGFMTEKAIRKQLEVRFATLKTNLDDLNSTLTASLVDHDGGWSNWGTWSECSATCGNGFKKRSRECTSPKPSAYGEYCRGQQMDIVSCNNNRCPDIMSSFSVTKPKSKLNGYLTFTTTIYNLGGDFNPSTGIFTCSKPGVYMFTFTLVKRRDSTRVDLVICRLRKNSSDVIVGLVDPTDDDTDKGSAYAGNIAVIHLNGGDIVTLSDCSDPSTYMEHWTSFSGFLLYPDV